MGKACEECTQNCVKMHQTCKDPSSLVTTFFKVMMGDDYSKYLFLPPRFARTVKKLVDKITHLEGFSGEKWDVKITKIHGKLVFEEGWNKFALYHGIQKGDFLVFHYIKNSHFVVLIYGPTGCPENRHFGLHNQLMKETKKNDDNLTVNNQSPSEVNTTCNNFSHESSSRSEPLVHGVKNKKTINKKLNEVNMSPNKNTINTQHLVASSSQPLDKETDQISESLDKNTNKKTGQISEPLGKSTDKEANQRSEPLVKNADKETDQRSEPLLESTIPDDMASKSPTTGKPSGLVDDGNGYEADEGRRNIMQQVVAESDSGQKNNAAISGGGLGETKINPTTVKPSGLVDDGYRYEADEGRRNILQQVVAEPDSGQKNNAATSGGGLGETKINRLPSLQERLKMPDERWKERKMRQNEDTHNSSMLKRSRPASVPNTPSKIVKTEPDTSASRLHNSAKPMEPIKKEPTMIGLGGPLKKEPTMKRCLDGLKKREPKPEPIDDDDAPLSDPPIASFSATMSSYQYLELPSSVKWKRPSVILLRNDTDLWAVLFQFKFGLKALTQNWGTFAKEKGIKPGDKCVFVLESMPSSRSTSTCNVFDVHVISK